MLAGLRHSRGLYTGLCIRWFHVEGIVGDLFGFKHGENTTEHGTSQSRSFFLVCTATEAQKAKD